MTMRTERLADLAAPLGLRVEAANPQIDSIEVDSRRVQPGALFCAFSGTATDGTRFVPQAIERGACAVLAGSSRPADLPAKIGWIHADHPRKACAGLARELFGRPDEALQMVGVTGTNGKTSVTWMIERIAATVGQPFGRIGTTGIRFEGLQLPATHTTPESNELWALLDTMRDAGAFGVALEVSSHALAQSRVAAVAFDVAVFLNLGRDHLDYHGDESEYFEAKAQLFDGLAPSARAVLPADDPLGDRLANRTRAEVLRFAVGAPADVCIEDGRSTVHGTQALLVHGDRSIAISSPLVGLFHLQNFAAAAAVTIALGWPLEAAAEGLSSLQGIPGRMEPIDMGQPFGVLIDYAHTEEALKLSLMAVRAISEGRLILVFGCGGDRDRSKRPRMGDVAATYADEIWLTSDNPRHENPEMILDEVEAGIAAVGRLHARTHRQVDRTRAIESALASAAPGDLVLIAGKGHESVQILAEGPVPFDDRDVARAALAGLGFEGVDRADA
jgi:UDP-N-acetylmuramoyl-L-alanyl-D-glutamate--2,6-diaminopimelate ligase